MEQVLWRWGGDGIGSTESVRQQVIQALSDERFKDWPFTGRIHVSRSLNDPDRYFSNIEVSEPILNKYAFWSREIDDLFEQYDITFILALPGYRFRSRFHQGEYRLAVKLPHGAYGGIHAVRVTKDDRTSDRNPERGWEKASFVSPAGLRVFERLGLDDFRLGVEWVKIDSHYRLVHFALFRDEEQYTLAKMRLEGLTKLESRVSEFYE